jgi:hypothetical protein
MAGGQDDLAQAYRDYLERFEARLGPCEVGAYAKHHGRLVKKLAPDEFAVKLREFTEVDRAYASILENGDTINDVLAKVLRERCLELVIDREIL